MLDGPMKEACSAEGAIPLPNHRHAVFLAFLEFLYTDKVDARVIDRCVEGASHTTMLLACKPGARVLSAKNNGRT